MIAYHVVVCCIISYYIILCYTMLYYAIPYHGEGRVVCRTPKSHARNGQPSRGLDEASKTRPCRFEHLHMFKTDAASDMMHGQHRNRTREARVSRNMPAPRNFWTPRRLSPWPGLRAGSDQHMFISLVVVTFNVAHIVICTLLHM